MQEQRKAQNSAFSRICWNYFIPYLVKLILNSSFTFSLCFHSHRGWSSIEAAAWKAFREGTESQASCVQCCTDLHQPQPSPSAQTPSRPWVLLHEQPGELSPKELPSSKRAGHARTVTVLKTKTKSPFWTWKFPFFILIQQYWAVPTLSMKFPAWEIGSCTSSFFFPQERCSEGTTRNSVPSSHPFSASKCPLGSRKFWMELVYVLF